MKENKNKFDRNVNKILDRLGYFATENLVFKLIASQGLQSLLYGVIAVFLTKSDLNCLDFAYNNVVAKLVKVKNYENIRSCQYYSGYLSFSYCDLLSLIK